MKNGNNRMNADLFQIPEEPSPRLTWLRTNDLIVREYTRPNSLNGAHRWICANRAQTRFVCADTEDAAEQRYCELFGLTWWKLADWNGAMESIKQVRAFSPIDESALVTDAPMAGWDF